MRSSGRAPLRRGTWIVALVALIVVLSLGLCGMETGLQLSVSLSVACCAAIALYGAVLPVSRCGLATLLAVSAVMSAGVIINVYGFVVASGASVPAPDLVNPDMARFFRQATEISQGASPAHGNTVPLFSYATALLWVVFGRSIVYPMALNVALTLISVTLAGKLAVALLKDKVKLSQERVAALAMGLVAVCCNYLGQGMVPLKEPYLYVGFLMTAVVVARMYRREPLSARHYLCFAAGALLLGTSRPPMLFFTVMGLLLLSPRFYRSHWPAMAIALCLAAASLFVGARVTRLTVTTHTDIVSNEAAMGDEYMSHSEDNRYDNYSKVVGEYYRLPAARRVVLLPVTSATQYVVPFPWNFGRDTKYGYTQAYNHVGYPWYAVGGVILFYLLLLWWRRGVALRLWALWPVMCWLVVAFLYAGTISRYTLSFIPLMTPLAIVALDRLLQGLHRKTFACWCCVYTAVMAAGLVACHHFQQALG